MPLPTRGIEDTLLSYGVLGILVLVQFAIIYLLYKELKACRADQLAEVKGMVDKHLAAQERAALVQEKMAGVIEERNRTTQTLADSLTKFAGSFEHSTEMNKLFLKQALEKLNVVAARQDAMAALQDTELKTIAALGESVRALNQRDQRGVLGRAET